jgi:protoheme IX farnesyltransferase
VTRRQIGLYTVPMAIAAVAPWPLGLTGAVYGLVSLATTAWFGVLAVRVSARTTGLDDPMLPEKALFKYSILYLFVVFAALVADRWLA